MLVCIAVQGMVSFTDICPGFGVIPLDSYFVRTDKTDKCRKIILIFFREFICQADFIFTGGNPHTVPENMFQITGIIENPVRDAVSGFRRG